MSVENLESEGELIVIGTGILGYAHMTVEALSALEWAEDIFYLVSDSLTERWLLETYPHARTLYHHYKEGEARLHSYQTMCEEVLASVRKKKNTVLASYGHPGNHAYPTRLAIHKARSEGFSARMLPAVAADSCLMADLLVDPGDNGWQSVEATDLLLESVDFSVFRPLVIWQPAVIGDLTYSHDRVNQEAFDLLKKRLVKLYGPDHKVCIYEASTYAVMKPRMDWLLLSELLPDLFTCISTLFIPELQCHAEQGSLSEELCSVIRGKEVLEL
ncbi:SAM-dependent methyltransferase [Endozoicomonas arenosclerae]|uniref:SAM-dependent methyltransferase n=1 Tax=Endozoicomonas arenosclerae TaxID=1633495 RepID=UPI000782C628|nr:SAM-dependent methyltransferase [Endozoicomonas arenosclerae]